MKLAQKKVRLKAGKAEAEVAEAGAEVVVVASDSKSPGCCCWAGCMFP